MKFAATSVFMLVLVGLTACSHEDPVAPTQTSFTKIPGAATGGRPLHAALLPVGALAGSGAALITLNHGQGEICWDVTASNVALPSGLAHIHGPFPSAAVVFPFAGPDNAGVSTGCTDGIDRALIRDILKSPGSYFVNLHPPAGGTDVTGFLSK